MSVGFYLMTIAIYNQVLPDRSKPQLWTRMQYRLQIVSIKTESKIFAILVF